MAHNLAQVGNRVMFAYNGELPWHGLGQNVERAMTSAEAIRAAALDWEVSARSIAAWGPGLIPLDSHKAIVRTCADSGKLIPLGVVGSKFQPIQNREVFDFMDSLVEGGAVKYETAGAIRDGREVFLAAKVAADPLEIVPGDKVEQYLVACNGHDGTRALTVFFSSVRVVCQNTLNLALGQSRGAAVKIAHRGDVMAKQEIARKVLGMSEKRGETFQAQARAMADREMTAVEFANFAAKLVPDADPSNPAQVQRVEIVRNLMTQNFMGAAKGSELAGKTRWGALNAVTEFTSHAYSPRATGDRRFSLNFGGANDELAQRAYVMLAA